MDYIYFWFNKAKVAVSLRMSSRQPGPQMFIGFGLKGYKMKGIIQNAVFLKHFFLPFVPLLNLVFSKPVFL